MDEKKVEKFNDFKHSFLKTDIKTTAKPFAKEKVDIQRRETKLLSKSALNVLAYCPKNHFYNKLVDGPDKVYFKKGHILHHFAEFYINHPNFVDSHKEDIFVELMLEEILPYIDSLTVPAWDTQFRVGKDDFIVDTVRGHSPIKYTPIR